MREKNPDQIKDKHMKKFKTKILLVVTLGITINLSAQNERGPLGFPELEFEHIEGAPKLNNPILIMGETKPVMTEKHGLCAPALYDWNNDGKRDLLVGEFETTSREHYSDEGSTIRVYLNIGTDESPKFNDEWEYARDIKGRPLEVDQWCCIGFTPKFHDLNQDGFTDILTGQYHPGEITWFRGTSRGFRPGVKVLQEGDPNSNRRGSDSDITSFGYWNYSSADFGDFDGDGDLDLVVGGSALRIAENVGTKDRPEFARRKPLLDVNGNPITIREFTEEDKKQYKEYGMELPLAGGWKTSPTVCDWDNDGILDLLVTNNYRSANYHAVDFFKGVKTSEGHRFEPAVSLFEAKNGSKAFPGSGQRVTVDDWNKDGVMDLIVGASIITVDGNFHDKMSWEYEDDLGIESAGKDYGRYPDQFVIETFEEYMKGEWVSGFLANQPVEKQKEFYNNQMNFKKQLKKFEAAGVPDAPKMIHKGYVYVFLGTK